MRLSNPSWLISTLLLLGACMSHEKAGDRAAAVGDWRKAVLDYRRAVEADPEDGSKRAKYVKAKSKAAELAMTSARQCFEDREYSCALSEAEYVLTLDPGSREASSIRRSARTGMATQSLEAAKTAVFRPALQQGLPVQAWVVIPIEFSLRAGGARE